MTCLRIPSLTPSLIALCLLAWAGLGTAQAQVMRCTDARTGQVTYTDGECSSGAQAREVERRRSPEEIQQEREQAAQAQERKQQRLQAEAARDDAEGRRALREQQLDNARRGATASPNYARSTECARSRRNLDGVITGSSSSGYEQQQRIDAAQRQVDLDCLGPNGYADLERSRAQSPVIVPSPVIVVPPRPHPRPPPPPPTPAPERKPTQCNVFRCYDGQGNSWPR